MPAKQSTIDAAEKAKNYLIIRTATVRGLEGLNWYEDARTDLAALCESEGFDYLNFILVMAATSPRVKVWMNVRHAIRVMRSLKANNGDVALAVAAVPGIMKDMRKATIKALNAGDTSTLGPKSACFAENLLGNEYMVTLDVWMARLVGLEGDDASSVTTKMVSKPYMATVRQVAANLGYSPAQVQAACWTYISKKLGNATDGEGDFKAIISKALATA